MSIDLRALKNVDRKAFHDVRRAYQKHHRTFTKKLTQIPKDEWPPKSGRLAPDECWRSQEFLVQIFRPQGHPVRLSISRTVLDADGNWKDGITWDEMQRVKAEVGFRHEWAVEVFPPDHHVVNVANIRHLWIVPAPDFAWHNAELTHPETKP